MKIHSTIILIPNLILNIKVTYYYTTTLLYYYTIIPLYDIDRKYTKP